MQNQFQELCQDIAIWFSPVQKFVFTWRGWVSSASQRPPGSVLNWSLSNTNFISLTFFYMYPFWSRAFFRKHWWSTRKYFGLSFKKQHWTLVARKAHPRYVMSHVRGKAVSWVYNRRDYGYIWATRSFVGSRAKSLIPQIKSCFVVVVSVRFILL